MLKTGFYFDIENDMNKLSLILLNFGFVPVHVLPHLLLNQLTVLNMILFHISLLLLQHSMNRVMSVI